MCVGLGEFAETIASGFGAMAIKFMVYNEAVLPVHRDFVLQQHLFRVSISLSKCMPDFAMCYEETKNVFEIARGFLTAVITDMHAAGRMAINRGWGVIKHGTLRILPQLTLHFSCLTWWQVIGLRCYRSSLSG
jgi:hypothetical protein